VFVRSWRAVDVCVAAAALAWFASAAAGTPSDDKTAPERVRLLDVPYVPQSGALCGGAALAMVLRYWGMTGVLAEDFTALVEPGQAGIRTDALVRAVEAYGWIALPLLGTPAEVEDHVAQGRPVIALIRAGSDSYHYVVLVAWANGWVILHDPKVGPFRAVREGEFNTTWSGSGNWALMVLPPQQTNEHAAADSATAAASLPAATDGCDAMVEAGILLARQGDSAQAEVEFLAAESLCPASAAPLRERAGLRFRADDWAGASRLAERALALDPDDADTWRLLAGSRFLAGDVDGALRAWNRVSEPRADLTRIDGLKRIRYSAVAGQLGLPPRRLLTSRAFRRARRRLAEVPAQVESRLSLRPMPEGKAQLNVTLMERPLVFDGPWDVGSAGIKALIRREFTLDVASPTGNGELWTAGWRWWKNRPRVSLALAVPAAGGRPGIWRLDAFWERQAYAVRALSGSSDATRPEVSREERRRTALSFSDWLGPDLRLEIGAALDEWVDRGRHLSLEGSIESRWARDRVALGAQAARWVSLARGAPFGTGGLSIEWCSSGLQTGDAWQGRLGISSATSSAPLALWSGAGTGDGRDPLLRAHPLLGGGVIRGRVFGRTLVHGTIERRTWPWRLGPVQLGWALFVDAAKPWNTGRAEQIPWQVDGGTGLRLRSLGMKGQIRVDAAHGFEDGSSAFSVGWEIR
jgi:tetratricopeptide (TPR) repeat protein